MLKNIIREHLEEKICDLIKKQLDKIYLYDDVRNPKFTKEVRVMDNDGDYSYAKVFIIQTKTYYIAIINDMIKEIETLLGISKEESYQCIKQYVDDKINKKFIMVFDDEENFIQDDNYDDDY